MSSEGSGDDVEALDRVDRIHAAVDGATARLESLHADRLECHRGCSGCCVDHISVLAIEADKIRRDFPELLRSGKPHPEGACAFLDADGACRIYRSRPHVCRIQGLPLRWSETHPDGRVLEYRDICPLNEEPDRPVEALAAEDCWTLGRVEAALAELTRHAADDEPRREKLRSLFRRSEPLEVPERLPATGEPEP